MTTKWLSHPTTGSSTRQPRVDFIKVGRKAQIMEIALSKLGARRKANPTPLKSFSKVGRRARKGRKKFMKSTPSLRWLTNKKRC